MLSGMPPRRLAVAVVAACFMSAPALAQQRPAAIPADTTHLILQTQLGGDSSQVTTVQLRAGATYLIATRTRGAQISVRHLARNGIRAAPLDTLPRQSSDTVPGWFTYRFAAHDAGEHSIELTNPAIGATPVKVILLHRAAGDTLPTTLQHELVFSDHIGPTPNYVTLDSGVTYRILSNVNVYIAPRHGGAPPFEAVFADAGAAGVAFRAVYGGEYSLQTDGDDGSVRIYMEASDQVANACQKIGGSGCPYRPRHSIRGVLFAAALIPAAMILGMVFK